MLVLVLAPLGFYLGFLLFLPTQKLTHSSIGPKNNGLGANLWNCHHLNPTDFLMLLFVKNTNDLMSLLPYLKIRIKSYHLNICYRDQDIASLSHSLFPFVFVLNFTSCNCILLSTQTYTHGNYLVPNLQSSVIYYRIVEVRKFKCLVKT